MTPRYRRIVLAAVAVVVPVVLALDAGLPPAVVEVVAIALMTAVGLRAASRIAVDTADGRGRTRTAPARPADVEQARTRLVAATRSSGNAALLLAPAVRELAAHRCERHGVASDDVDAMRALLGEDLFRLVDPARRRPRDRDAPGLTPDQLRRAVERLEQL